MGKLIDKDKCDTCIHAWTDGCPLQKCWEDGYKYYNKQLEEKMGIKRLTYDAGKKHYCDYSTKDIINRLAECEIKLEKIDQIISDGYLQGKSSGEMLLGIKGVLNGNDD
ncbi:MAG: hypothetical protein IKR19_08375 [Acholeplasmatales bacterium]|nr:hypothetical protein [Acholeplasmatales bacterium]